MPAATRSRSFSGVAVAGPMVHTIFARLLTIAQTSPVRWTDPGDPSRLTTRSSRGHATFRSVPRESPGLAPLGRTDVVGGPFVQVTQLPPARAHAIGGLRRVQRVVRFVRRGRVQRLVSQQVDPRVFAGVAAR